MSKLQCRYNHVLSNVWQGISNHWKIFFPYSNHSVIECLNIHFEMSLAFTPTKPFLQPCEYNWESETKDNQYLSSPNIYRQNVNCLTQNKVCV